MKLFTYAILLGALFCSAFFISSCNNEYKYVVFRLPTCTVTQVPQGALIECPNGQATLVSNGNDGTNGVDGQDGADGQDGQDALINGLTIIEIINPCGDAPGVYDEVFLRLSDDTIVSSFSESASGTNTRFSVLSPGSFVTTDGDRCYFTVNSNNDIVNEHH